jgi:hypothetical protein
LRLDIEIGGRRQNRIGYEIKIKRRGVIGDKAGGNEYKKRVNRRV